MLDYDVIVAGAGLGGLCAAAGLRRAGLRVLVFERDAGLTSRPQGYRININAAGDAGLRACLPEAHFALYRETAHRQVDASVDVFDTDLQRLLLHRTGEASGPGPAPSAVDRATLRAILLDAAEEVRFGCEVVDVNTRTDGAEVHLSDGSRIRTGLVVAADGAHSTLRRRLLPRQDPEPLGVVGIYGRAPLDPSGLMIGAGPSAAAPRAPLRRNASTGAPSPRAGAALSFFGAGPSAAAPRVPLRACDGIFLKPRGPRSPKPSHASLRLLRRVIEQRFVGVTDGAGTTLALGAWNPRQAPAEAASERVPGIKLPSVAPYIMWVLLGPADAVPGSEASPESLHRFALTAVSGWNPAATRFVREAIVPDTFRVTLRKMASVPSWVTGRVTFLGDAIHAMSPAGGEGANTALADAASLLSFLQANGLNGLNGLTAYEHDLRERAQGGLDRSANYGREAPTHA